MIRPPAADLTALPGAKGDAEQLPSHLTRQQASRVDRKGPAKSRGVDLKTLCQKYTQGLVRVSGSDVRHQVFLWGLSAKAGKQTLLLDGLTHRFPEAAPATLDFSDLDGHQFWLKGCLRTSDNRTYLEIRRGPTRRPHRASRLRPRGLRAAVVFSVQDPGMARLCFPIVDLNANALRLNATQPLAPGMVLSKMVIAIEQTSIRWCTGVVTDVTEIAEPTGRRRYHCGVKLRPAGEYHHWPIDDTSTQMTDARHMRDLLWAMCDFERPIVLAYGATTLRAQLLPAAGNRMESPTMRCTALDTVPESTVGTVRVECTVFGASFEFLARLKKSDDSTFVLSPGPALRERHRRSAPRTSLRPDLNAEITYSHPVTGVQETARILDMGSSGLSFLHTEASAVFWTGLPLGTATLHCADTTCTIAEIQVRRVGVDNVGISFRPLDDANGDCLRVALFGMTDTPIQLHDGRDFKSVMDLHRSTGLLEPEMVRWLDLNHDDVANNWKHAHRLPSGLMRTAIVPWRGEVGASLTSVRAYERTWCLQHSSVRSATVPTGAGILHSSLMALAAARADGEYIAGFVDAAARSLHTMVNGFMHRSLAGHRGAHEFTLYSADELSGSHATGNAVRRLRRRDHRLVENVARRCLDPVCASALSLTEGEIELPDTQAAYHKLGLARGRQAWGAFRDGRCTAVMLQEFASPGLSLSGLLGAAMFLPLGNNTSPGEEETRADLCRVTRSLRLPGLTGVRFLLLPVGCSDRPVISAGYAPVGTCSLFAFHRLSLEEYNRYVENRYGLLRGRLKARTRENPR